MQGIGALRATRVCAAADGPPSAQYIGGYKIRGAYRAAERFIGPVSPNTVAHTQRRTHAHISISCSHDTRSHPALTAPPTSRCHLCGLNLPERASFSAAMRRDALRPRRRFQRLIRISSHQQIRFETDAKHVRGRRRPTPTIQPPPPPPSLP